MDVKFVTEIARFIKFLVWSKLNLKARFVSAVSSGKSSNVEEHVDQIKILIVEGNDVDFNTISKLLEAFGIITGRAISLKDASRVDYLYDLILLDTSLPDACSTNVIKYFIETARAPLIVISGASDAGSFSDSITESGSRIVDRSSFGLHLRDIIREIVTFAASRRKFNE